MTRFLRSALGAPEPTFSQGIRQLEQAAGAPNTDIRLTSDIVQQVKVKIKELGLDPNDTTGPELYEVLRQRLDHDESLVRYRLGVPVDAPAEEVIARVRQFLDKLDAPKSSFAIKTAVARKLLKTKPPKTAMKRLGYRSVDSMLKHESPALLLAAATLYEPTSWHKTFYGQYTKLQPSDFETRPISLLHPRSAKWQQVARDFVATKRHALLGLRELGAVVMLATDEQLEGMAITTLLLAIEEMNTIRAYSSYVKLQQVKPTFGRIVQQASGGDLSTTASLAGHTVSWEMVQRFYGSSKDVRHAELFEPHVQPEDLTWQQGEQALTQLEPTLQFWQGTAMLALMHQDEPVSMNIIDVALNHTNQLAFPDRVVHFFRENVWHELMARYLHQENLESAVHQQLSDELLEQPSQEVTV